MASSPAFIVVVAICFAPVDFAIRVHHSKQQVDVRVEQRGKRTSVEAKQMAVEEFTTLLGSFCDQGPGDFEYKGVSGQCSLKCGSRSYTGPVDGLGYGAHGVTVTMRSGSTSGAKVVAKLFKGEKERENLGHECEILNLLERHNVPGVLKCAGSCENNGYPMIIVEPFLEGRQSFLGPLEESYFDSPQAIHKTAVNMMKTAVAMLSAGVANIDQGHNMLFSKDGQVTFIDMGLATDLRTEIQGMMGYHVKRFSEHMFNKIPVSWYKDERFKAVMNEVSLPSTPKDVAARGLDIAAVFKECQSNKESSVAGEPGPKPVLKSKPEPKPVTRPVPPTPQVNVLAFKVGQEVEYYSTTNAKWMVAIVGAVDRAHGTYDLLWSPFDFAKKPTKDDWLRKNADPARVRAPATPALKPGPRPVPVAVQPVHRKPSKCFRLVPESFVGTWESDTKVTIKIMASADSLEIRHAVKGTHRYDWDKLCEKDGYNGLKWAGLLGTFHEKGMGSKDLITWSDRSFWIRKSWLVD